MATDASALNTRPLDPDDVERLRRLFYRLSPRTRYARSARDRGVETFTGTTLSDNPAIGAFVRALAAEPRWRWDGGCRLVEVDLRRELVAATPARQPSDSRASGSITGRIRASQVVPRTKPPTTSVR